MRHEVYGPDGRRWTVTRKREEAGLLARLLSRGRWVVEATTEGPPPATRHWYADRASQANELVEGVAMSLRTGTEGPPQPED